LRKAGGVELIGIGNGAEFPLFLICADNDEALLGYVRVR
jgi:hypothetical protein